MGKGRHTEYTGFDIFRKDRAKKKTRQDYLVFDEGDFIDDYDDYKPKKAKPADKVTVNRDSNRQICKIYKKCGGCSLQNLDYDSQLRLKQKKANELLDKYNIVNKIIPMAKPTGYRCKVQTAYIYDKSAHCIKGGVFQSKTKHIITHDYCMIENAEANKINKFFCRLANEYKLTAYDIKTGKGFLRHTLIRVGKYTGEIMLVIVTTCGDIPHQEEFIRKLVAQFPSIKTIVQNINVSTRDLTLSDKQKVLYGEGFIYDKIGDLKFKISPKSFYQINPEGAKILYETALKAAKIHKNDMVIDAYCGTGTITLLAAKMCGNILGVESNTDAVKDAKVNAEINGIKNAEFVAADATNFLFEYNLMGERRPDLIIMDPPRAGATQEFLASIKEASPKKVLYISCSPESLARDLRTLTADGYKVNYIQPVDMFPYTSHLETIVVLTKA